VDAELLREPLARLPRDQRRVLVLAAFYGFTAREISELDGLPLGTVKTRIRSAMLKLRSQLSGLVCKFVRGQGRCWDQALGSAR
jgi:RNA polymerase sigma factor (sigma-70 family)